MNCLIQWRENFKKGLCDEIDYVAGFLIFWTLFHRHRLWSGSGKWLVVDTTEYLNFSKLGMNENSLEGFSAGALSSWTQLKNKSPLEIMTQHCLRGIPLAAHQAWLSWRLGTVPLILYNHVPDALALLQMQSLGRRCVTVFSKPEDWKKKWGRRDACQFVWHDLVHAQHFFSCPEYQRGQIGFYRWMLGEYQKPGFGQLFKPKELSAPDLMGELEYVISDMNSHCIHLFLTFLNVWLKAIKQESGEQSIIESLRALLSSTDLSPQWKQKFESSFRTRSLGTFDFEELQKYFESLGA